MKWSEPASISNSASTHWSESNVECVSSHLLLKSKGYLCTWFNFRDAPIPGFSDLMLEFGYLPIPILLRSRCSVTIMVLTDNWSPLYRQVWYSLCYSKCFCGGNTPPWLLQTWQPSVTVSHCHSEVTSPPHPPGHSVCIIIKYFQHRRSDCKSKLKQKSDGMLQVPTNKRSTDFLGCQQDTPLSHSCVCSSLFTIKALVKDVTERCVKHSVAAL